MAEKSPRPGAEEDAEEDGEEAAEATEAPLVEEEVPESPPPSEEPPPEEAEESPPPEEAAEPPPEEAEKSPPPEEAEKSPPPAQPAPEPLAFYPVVAPLYPAQASVSGMNLFANDGSFLELFKKKMEASSAGDKEASKEPEERKPEADRRRPGSLVGKRRGGAKLALKTGMVTKKPKTEDEEVLTHKGGAWAQYMAEVKKYKAHQCSDDDKTRPLVK